MPADKQIRNKGAHEAAAAGASSRVDESLLTGGLIPLTRRQVRGSPPGTFFVRADGSVEGWWKYWKDRIPSSTPATASPSTEGSERMVPVVVDKMDDGREIVVAEAPAVLVEGTGSNSESRKPAKKPSATASGPRRPFAKKCDDGGRVVGPGRKASKPKNG